MVSTNITQLLATYINALHILHHHGVLDGYGHLSVRNPNNPPTFFMSHQDLAPALVSGLDDISEYRVSDAEPVDPDSPPTYLERFIHSEIYKKYPDVKVVMHGHAEPLVSFSISDVPLRPTTGQAAFLGDRVPVFDITKYYRPNDTQTLIVNNQRLGAALAKEFSSSATVASYSNSSSSSPENKKSSYPAHNLVLMQSHGFISVATDLKVATFEGIYAVIDANIQSEALQIQHAYTGRAASASGGGMGDGVVYLTPRQVRDSTGIIQETVDRPWRLWEREVRVNPLYVNELDEQDH